MDKILVFGGYVNNKGAQSMLFTVVDKIKKKYPDAKVLLVTERQVEQELKDLYNFNFLEIGFKEKLVVAGFPFSLMSLLKRGNINKGQLKNFVKEVKDSDLAIDISGFALSSKFTRNNTINYISNISVCKKFNVPTYLMPQSFGPFQYNILEKVFLIPLIKKYMKFPTRIYAREKEGYNYLVKMGLNNTTHALDTVFHKSDEYKLDNLYKITPTFRPLKIKKDSVGVIPNVKTINNNIEQIIKIYINAITALRKKDKNVYILRHSTEDLNFIEKIYQHFKDDDGVILIKEEFSSIELQRILKNFNYIIASRYHSIVHAYKGGTPALVIGWATKYRELMREFDQERYQFDVNKFNNENFLHALENLDHNCDHERSVITTKIVNLKENDIFEEVL